MTRDERRESCAWINALVFAEKNLPGKPEDYADANWAAHQPSEEELDQPVPPPPADLLYPGHARMLKWCKKERKKFLRKPQTRANIKVVFCLDQNIAGFLDRCNQLWPEALALNPALKKSH